VSNDSGAMHLAAASGARVLGIFLSTDPLWTAPLGPEARFLAASVKCRPCFERKCPLPKMICREAVCTEDVIKSLDDWLETS
jgi:heptosyltransferase-2